MIRTIALIPFVLACFAAHAEDSLLLRYTFEEGSGATVHDSSGNHNDGTLHGGATWATGQPFNALSFDGKDAFIEGPSGLDLGTAGTLEVWCYPRVFGGGLISWHYEHPSTPKPLSLYFDIYTYNNLLGVMSDWHNPQIEKGADPYVYWNAAPTLVLEGRDLPAELLNRWSHIVMTYDTTRVFLFRNGKLQTSKPARFSPDTKHVPIRIGVGYAQGIPYFDGMIAEASVYTRALGANEIADRFAAKSTVFQPNLPYRISIVPRYNNHEETLQVIADVARLDGRAQNITGELVQGTTVLQTVTPPITPNDQQITLNFSTHGLTPGDYILRATVTLTEAPITPTTPSAATAPIPPITPITPITPIGPISPISTTCTWRLPKLATPTARALNNLVAELLDRNDLTAQPDQSIAFTNPRAGWVFVSCAAEVHDSDLVKVAIDGAEPGTAITLSAATTASAETMCYLAEGAQTLHIQCEGNPKIRTVAIRAIPELMYCGYPTGAGKVPGYGPYNFDFLKKDVLPNINTIVASGGAVSLASQRWTDAEKETWRQFHAWRSVGRHWLQEYDIPSVASSYDWKNKPLTGDQAVAWATQSEGFTDPDFNGFVANEFGLGADGPTDTHPHRDPRYRTAPYLEAVQKIAADPAYKDKVIHVWCGGLDRAESRSQTFVNAVIAAGGKLATEEYLAERATSAEAEELLRNDLCAKIERATATFPGLPENLILVPSILSAPPESDDADPDVDFKVWMDMQMRYMATAPELFGLAGIMWYKITCSDEEAVRWMGRLYRHYAIEGQTSLLSESYGYNYNPNIIANADFDDSLNGWTINPATPHTIRVEAVDKLNYFQGRRLFTKGTRALVLQRDDKAPNTLTQKLQNLKPGQAYSARMFVADSRATHEGLKWSGEHVPTDARLTITDADPITDKSFVCPVSSERGPQWIDLHRVVFRATAPTATLTISDWKSDTENGGAVGQEIAINFVEVRPYFE